MKYIYCLFPILNKLNPILYYSTFSSDNAFYRYGSKNRKAYKKTMNYTGFVQDHHCIPKQFKNHKLLRETNYDVNMAYNLLIMPTDKGIEKLNLHPNTRTHYKGHREYNKYIQKNLDVIYKKETTDEKCYYMWLMNKYLKNNLTFNDEEIPWN